MRGEIGKTLRDLGHRNRIAVKVTPLDDDRTLELGGGGAPAEPGQPPGEERVVGGPVEQQCHVLEGFDKPAKVPVAKSFRGPLGKPVFHRARRGAFRPAQFAQGLRSRTAFQMKVQLDLGQAGDK